MYKRIECYRSHVETMHEMISDHQPRVENRGKMMICM